MKVIKLLFLLDEKEKSNFCRFYPFRLSPLLRCSLRLSFQDRRSSPDRRSGPGYLRGSLFFFLSMPDPPISISSYNIP
jgi:hypothetical protein